MKGKATFTKCDAEIIRQKLGHVRRADRDLQKKLRGTLRDMGFYISDFTSSSRGFTGDDFDELVQRGSITIV
ncbi:MAG: hypothetical protein IPK78_17600 [Rhodospirillales bacterium]|nr:hypothetical protein [Rhodospirillales bacterium]